MRQLPKLLCVPAALAMLGAGAQALPERQNWFGDPFFQVAGGLPACPQPLGPLLTQDEHRQQAHGRIERGTRCHMEGKCTSPNAYLYDKTLAAPVRAALAAVPDVARSSVWVTIQRRWVFLEGCVHDPGMVKRLEQAARAVPDVEAVVPLLGIGTRDRPRYDVKVP